MHILVTADTVGGVWTWASELVRGLLRRGHRVTLVSFGDIPVSPRTQWMDGLDLDYHPTAFKLEWMQDSEADLKASAEYLEAVASEIHPDIIHLSQFYYGAMKSDAPRLLVAHSDVVSWWQAVHGTEPPDSAWIRWYRRIVSLGLASAQAVVAPSRWMLQQVERFYGRPERGLVVYNGRTPSLFNPHLSKEEQVLTVGRLWDSGKNASLLLQQEMPLPVVIAGSECSPEHSNTNFFRPTDIEQIHVQPRQNEREMQSLFARAAVYAATSCYEPFGLAPLEAALSRCAIVASDIPSFRELWEGAAVFFRNNDSGSLKDALRLVSQDREFRLKYGNLAFERAKRDFGAERMVEEYLNIYRAIARIPSLTL